MKTKIRFIGNNQIAEIDDYIISKNKWIEKGLVELVTEEVPEEVLIAKPDTSHFLKTMSLKELKEYADHHNLVCSDEVKSLKTKKAALALIKAEVAS